MKYQVNNMMAFLADASGSFNTFLDQMNQKSSDAMTAQLLAASMDTYQTRLAQAKASFENLGVTIGSMVLPHLKNFALLMTGLGQYLQQHAGAIVGVAGACAKLAFGFFAVSAAMGTWTIFQGIAAGVKSALTGVALAQGASAFAVMAYNTAVGIQSFLMTMATPLTMAWAYATSAGGIASGIASGLVGLLIGSIVTLETVLAPVAIAMLAVIAVIGALGTIAYVVYENWETVSNDLAYIWNMLVDVISAAIEAIILAFSPLFIAIYAIAEVVGWAIKEVIAPLFQWVAGVISSVITVINGWLTEHGVTTENIANAIRFIWNNFINWLASSISPAFAQWLNDMVQKLVDFANKVRSIASDVKNAIRSMFGMAQNAGENGGGWIDNIANGIKSKLNFDLLNSIADAKAGMENSPYAQEHNMPTGAMPNAIPSGGGGGSKGKGAKGARGGKEADNSIEAILYRFLTKEKGLSHNRAIGELANVQAMSGFDYKAGEGTDRYGLYGFDRNQQAKYQEWLKGTGYKDSAVSQINYQHTYAQKYDEEEKKKYQEYLKANSSTPQEFAQAFSDSISKAGAIDTAVVDALDKRFAKKKGEENYDDPMKALAERYKLLKQEFDREINDLKTERGKLGQNVSAEEQRKIYEQMMGIGDGKNPFAYLDTAIKDYEKVLLESAKYEAKRQEDIRKSTDTQVKAIEKMADSEIAFAEKLGLIDKADVRKYEWDKNESTYAKQKPLLEAKLGSTVDMDKGTADDMLAAYRGYVYAKTDLDAKYYAEKMFYLSRDVDATEKALSEMYKLEQSYHDKRVKLEQEAFYEKDKYTLKFIDSMTNAIQSGLEGILTRTKSFGEAFRDIFKSVVNDIIKMFTEDLSQSIKKWLSNLLHPQKKTGNPAGVYGDIDGGIGGIKPYLNMGDSSIGGRKSKGGMGGGAFDLIGWAQGSLSSLGGGLGMGTGKGKGNVLVNALGLNNFASTVKSAVQPGLNMLRQQTLLTINGISNISQTGMQTISAGVQTGALTISGSWGTMEATRVATTQAGGAAIVAQNQATAATVQATTAQMIGWIMAVLALFSLFGGGGGESTSESTTAINLGRSPDSYYMTPTPVLQSTTFNVPSFDIGGNIEQDMFAMVHKGEMVLTPEQADVIRNTARNGGSLGSNMGGSNANIKSNISVSTVDSRGFERVLKDYNRQLSKNVKKGIRNGYLNAKGLV